MAKVRFERSTTWAATSRVVFLGGNGHCAARLNPARSALARMLGAGKCAPLEILEVEYPGFEGRARAETWEGFVADCARQVAELATPSTVLYGTGIGGLILLALRARDVATETPIVLQGPVLWGLEKRRFPLAMRTGVGRTLVRSALRFPPVQWVFAGKYFVHRPPRDVRRAFFRGYARCSAFGDLFRWLAPPLLRSLEVAFREKPARLANIRAWWGKRDRVVTTAELRVTEEALQAKWPLREFEEWGHYPMIEQPENWIAALQEARGVSGDASAAAVPSPL